MSETVKVSLGARSYDIHVGGGLLARVQTGRVQTYLRLLALGFVVLAVILIWSSRP